MTQRKMERLHGMLLLLGCALVAMANAQDSNYEGHKIIRAYPQDASHRQLMDHMREANSFSVDFLGESDGGIDTHVPIATEPLYLSSLSTLGIKFETVVSNLQELIDQETKSNDEAKKKDPDTIVGTYATNKEMNDWMLLAASRSKIAERVYIGKTMEGRPIYLMKISAVSSQTKEAIFIEGGAHAREWMTSASVIWIINELISTYEIDGGVKTLVDRYDWYLLPTANPDGYEHSQLKDRLWRKTRSMHDSPFCIGVDMNRNFDYPQFGGVGTSSTACSSIYKGPGAFSEPETEHVQQYLLKLKGHFKMYISLHSYANAWLTPWAYGLPEPKDATDMERVAQAGADALYKVQGTKLPVGSPPKILHASGGAASDWAKGTAGAMYSYDLEIRPHGNSVIAPAYYIQPYSQELWTGIMAAVTVVKQ